MATKFGNMLTYLDRLLVIETRQPLIMWSCEITRKIKYIISIPTQCLWEPELAV